MAQCHRAMNINEDTPTHLLISGCVIWQQIMLPEHLISIWRDLCKSQER